MSSTRERNNNTARVLKNNNTHTHIHTQLLEPGTVVIIERLNPAGTSLEVSRVNIGFFILAVGTILYWPDLFNGGASTVKVKVIRVMQFNSELFKMYIEHWNG